MRGGGVVRVSLRMAAAVMMMIIIMVMDDRTDRSFFVR